MFCEVGDFDGSVGCGLACRRRLLFGGDVEYWGLIILHFPIALGVVSKLLLRVDK